ncbi:MAG: hypothetical protein RLZZ450_3764 [Pseudomonadota bacterium]|jgi:hypothetical protein
MADLVPTASPIAVGDEGSLSGKPFVVLGRLQLDHGRGPWDEWYLGFSDGSWGWLARAEGRWYATFEKPAGTPPGWETLAPSTVISLEGTGSVDWVVTERGGAATVSAEGELPYAVDPKGSGRYVDLEAEGGAFATLDFGDGTLPPLLFAGRELAASDLRLKQTAVGPRPVEQVEVARLACPTCGAPIDIVVPSEAERCGCAHCGSLLDFDKGALKLLEQLELPAIRPLIALGSVGELLGVCRTVIGFMQRSLTVDGDLYTFREYLLHSEQGFSWLLEENHHWLHVAPISTGDVQEFGQSARCKTVSYRAFAKALPSVDFVIGEFYWKVSRGDQSETMDYVAPPRLLSVERTDNEVSWSEGEYVEPTQLVRAFALSAPLPRPVGVAPAQPNPYTGRGATMVFALLAALWLVIALAYEVFDGERVLATATLELPRREALGVPAGVLQGSVAFSEPFEVRRGPTTLKVDLHSNVSNGWVQVDTSLVPEPGGTTRDLKLVSERYTGNDDGEGWAEGDSASSGYFGRVPSGRYTLRFFGSWQPNDNGWAAQATPPTTRLEVSQGGRSPACCCGTLLLIALPWLLSRLNRLSFELRRRQNENL